MKSFSEILGIEKEEKPISINASEGIALKNELQAVVEEEDVIGPSIGTGDTVMTQDGMMTPAMMSRKQRRYLYKLLGLRDGQLSKTEKDRRVAHSPIELKRRKKARKKRGVKY